MSNCFECPICLCDFNQGQNIPTILLGCGHTLCLHCVFQHVQNQARPLCPFCRQDLLLSEQKKLFLVNWHLSSLLTNKCQLHAEIKTLICLICKEKVCSACIYVDTTHHGHKIVHEDQIETLRVNKKNGLWKALDEALEFRNKVTQLLDNTQTSFKNKLHELPRNTPTSARNRLEKRIAQFFESQRSDHEEIQEQEEATCHIRMRIAQLDNPHRDEDFFEALSEDQIDLRSKARFDSVLQEILQIREELNGEITRQLNLAISQEQQELDDSLFVVNRLPSLNPSGDSLNQIEEPRVLRILSPIHRVEGSKKTLCTSSIFDKEVQETTFLGSTADNEIKADHDDQINEFYPLVSPTNKE